jgi:predicted amidophosphoribosyltransferase
MGKHRCIYCGEPVDDSSCLCKACQEAIDAVEDADDECEAVDLHIAQHRPARIAEGWRIMKGED